MKYIQLVVVVEVLFIVGVIGSSMISAFSKTQVKYNCELAEISPDFPKEVKQKCRELKNENRSMQ